jgi:hypothetical protein
MTKEDIINVLVKSGMTAADAEKAFVTAIPAVSTDADLLKKIAMQEATLEIRNKQIQQATDLFNRVNLERKAQEDADKSKLIDSIQIDSKFTKDDLKDKALSELQTMRLTLDKSLERTFASVSAQIDEEKRIREPVFTVGKFDSKTNSWKGGIV